MRARNWKPKSSIWSPPTAWARISDSATDENSLLLVEPGAVTELPLQPKAKLARALIRHIAARYRAKHTAKVHTLRRP